LHGNNAVEGILTDEFSRKHPVFPVSLIRPYTSRGTDTPVVTHVPVPIIEPLDISNFKLHKILKDTKERINGKDTRLYLVRYKGQSADKDEWIPEDNIPDGPIHLCNYKASKRN
jgi:hypothetical protein